MSPLHTGSGAKPHFMHHSMVSGFEQSFRLVNLKTQIVFILLQYIYCILQCDVAEYGCRSKIASGRMNVTREETRYEARSSGRVKVVAKIGDDIFFYLHGFVDNYTGYVLSRDTVIDLNELDSVERKMEYEHGLKCYAIFSR